MSVRLRSDIWADAYRRRCEIAGAYAVLRRRGAAEAGAIFILVDMLDGRAALYGPAPQTVFGEGETERRFVRQHPEHAIDVPRAEARIAKELRFDADLWVIEVEDRSGRTFLLPEETAEAP
jgi:hypothetical protein